MLAMLIRPLPEWMRIDDFIFSLPTTQAEAPSSSPSTSVASKVEADSPSAAGQEAVAKSHFGGRVQVNRNFDKA